MAAVPPREAALQQQLSEAKARAVAVIKAQKSRIEELEAKLAKRATPAGGASCCTASSNGATGAAEHKAGETFDSVEASNTITQLRKELEDARHAAAVAEQGREQAVAAAEAATEARVTAAREEEQQAAREKLERAASVARSQLASAKSLARQDIDSAVAAAVEAARAEAAAELDEEMRRVMEGSASVAAAETRRLRAQLQAMQEAMAAREEAAKEEGHEEASAMVDQAVAEAVAEAVREAVAAAKKEGVEQVAAARRDADAATTEAGKAKALAERLGIQLAEAHAEVTRPRRDVQEAASKEQVSTRAARLAGADVGALVSSLCVEIRCLEKVSSARLLAPAGSSTPRGDEKSHATTEPPPDGAKTRSFGDHAPRAKVEIRSDALSPWAESEVSSDVSLPIRDGDDETPSAVVVARREVAKVKAKCRAMLSDKEAEVGAQKKRVAQLQTRVAQAEAAARAAEAAKEEANAVAKAAEAAAAAAVAQAKAEAETVVRAASATAAAARQPAHDLVKLPSYKSAISQCDGDLNGGGAIAHEQGAGAAITPGGEVCGSAGEESPADSTAERTRTSTEMPGERLCTSSGSSIPACNAPAVETASSGAATEFVKAALGAVCGNSADRSTRANGDCGCAEGSGGERCDGEGGAGGGRCTDRAVRDVTQAGVWMGESEDASAPVASVGASHFRRDDESVTAVAQGNGEVSAAQSEGGSCNGGGQSSRSSRSSAANAGASLFAVHACSPSAGRHSSPQPSLLGIGSGSELLAIASRQASRDVELEGLRAQMLRSKEAEAEEQNREAAMRHRRGEVHIEYAKDLVLKYILLGESHAGSLFPALATCLQFSPTEVERMRAAVAARGSIGASLQRFIPWRAAAHAHAETRHLDAPQDARVTKSDERKMHLAEASALKIVLATELALLEVELLRARVQRKKKNKVDHLFEQLVPALP